MMKRILIGFAVFFGSFAMAESRGFDLELGPYLSFIDYSEKHQISQSGGLSGVRGRYSAYYPYSVTLIDLSYASGDTDYKGAGKISNVQTEIYDVKAMFGRSFYLNDTYRFTPFVGLGFRRSVMDSTGRISTTSVEGYKSQQTYLYNPIGFEIQQLIGETPWALGGRFEYDSFLRAENKTRLGAADSYRAVTLKPQSGKGYNLYLTFRRFLNQDGSGIVIEPFYKYWEASASDDNSVPQDTGNHSSSEWGAALLVSF